MIVYSSPTGFPQVTVHGDYHAGQQPVRESRVWTFEATRD